MKTAKLLFWCGVIYSILLVLFRGALPPESSPTLLLVGLPLVVIAVVISRDLVGRSTVPTIPQTFPYSSRSLQEDPVHFLSGQIRVAANASDSYFEYVARGRLRELLLLKVSLEEGLDRDAARVALSDPVEGPRLMRSKELYTILYGPVPSTGPERMKIVEQAIRMIGDWKG